MGSIDISSTSVADALLGEAVTQFTGGYTLVAGGDLTGTNGSVAAGDAYGGGPVNDFSLTMANGYSYTTRPRRTRSISPR